MEESQPRREKEVLQKETKTSQTSVCSARERSGGKRSERLKEEARLEEERERKEEIERQYQHELWLRRETLAQVEFKKKKQAEERVAKAREERERLIREEWEALQSKEKEEEERKKVERERKEALLQEALTLDQQEPAESWMNPLAPGSASSSGTRSHSSVDYGTERDTVHCSFFLKTGACRFGDRCSRSHPRLTASSTLLIPNMFQDIALVEQALEDRDNDVSLEFEEGELYERFKTFYDDVLPEFRRMGTVVQFKVCCNHEPHLRGNVYVQFSSEQECADAYKAFNGRWYAMRQLSCQFCPVVKWKTAICGQFQRRCCPKGKKCNFLHVFTNPGNTFWRADRDLPPPPSIEDRHRWSERRWSGYRQHRRSVSPRRNRRRSHRHASSSSRRHRSSSSRSGSDSDMEADTHHRNEKAGSSQRSSSVASDHSSREHKRRSSRMQDDSFHGNHRHHRHGSHHSNSHHRKRDSSHLSGEDSDQRQEKRSKGKKRKKHQHIHEDSSPEHTEDID